MAVNVYEGMFILDSNRYARDPEAVSGQIPKMIEALGGEMLVSRMWEERRLAYAIKGHRKGTYWLTYFRADGENIASLERQCHLSDTIIRVLFLKVDPRIVDALVAHAQQGPVKASDDAPGNDNNDDDDDDSNDEDEDNDLEGDSTKRTAKQKS